MGDSLVRIKTERAILEIFYIYYRIINNKSTVLAIAPRQVESLMPPPPAPVAAHPVPVVGAPPGGTVTRQSAMNPQGIELQLKMFGSELNKFFIPTRTTGGGAAARRRSNVVKEVERLEKNREERRARQAEIKEEKKALMNLDPGNPNWEFLSMIKCVRFLQK